VVANDRLYLRDQAVLRCDDLRAPGGGTKKRPAVVADLGCGDGRIVGAAAGKYGCRAVEYDHRLPRRPYLFGPGMRNAPIRVE
jgi:hypothetical protein